MLKLGYKCDVPVVFYIYKRPHLALQVFEAIARHQPKTLFIFADGPKSHEEAEQCSLTRHLVSRVNWSCDLKVHLSEVHMGCKTRITSGLNMVFADYERAIILEDDLVPSDTFFAFTEEMLEIYAHNPKIWSINGFNPLGDKNPSNLSSYYFSRRPFTWGWGTWRRVWEKYDVEIKEWPALRDGGWFQRLGLPVDIQSRWTHNFNLVHQGGINTWDYQFLLYCWRFHALNVIPSSNQISNIGHGSDATHTKERTSVHESATFQMQFPLRHPDEIKGCVQDFLEG